MAEKADNYNNEFYVQLFNILRNSFSQSEKDGHRFSGLNSCQIFILASKRNRMIPKNEIDVNHYCDQHKNDKISFGVLLKFTLKEGLADKWEGFAQGNRDEALCRYESLRSIEERKVQEFVSIVLEFTVNKIEFSDVYHLRNIKSMHKFNDSSNVSQRVRIEESCALDLSCIENNREGWCNIFRNNERIVGQNIFEFEIKDLLDKDTRIEIGTLGGFYVRLTEENDVTNLRYFLPIWHHYNSQGKPLKLEITSNISGDEQRVKQFFQKVSEELRNRIVFNKRRLDRSAFESGSSDILPMVCISQGIDPEKTNSYLDIIEDLIAYLLNLKNVATEELRYALFKNWLYKIGVPLSNDVYNQAIEVYSLKNFLVYLNNSKGIEKRNEKLSDDQITDNDLDHLLNKSLKEKSVNELIECFTKIYNEKRMDGEFGLLKVLKSDNVNKWLLLIFLFLLRNSFDIIINKGNNTVDYSIIDKIWFYAKAYAEGLLQLIENAQQHSNGHVAYFGMRIYKADPNSAMGTLAKETQTRTALWRKYWAKQIWNSKKKKLESVKMKVRKDDRRFNSNEDNNIFNNGHDKERRVVYPDFIEFYVLDDAIGTSSKASGIINKISEQNELNKDISSIGDIFELSENNYIDEDNAEFGLPNKLLYYIQHYGMRWLKSHIENLNGIMEIYSPYDPKDDKEEFGEKCCYSNVFKNLEDATPYFRDLFSTEYSILVPNTNGDNI